MGCVESKNSPKKTEQAPPPAEPQQAEAPPPEEAPKTTAEIWAESVMASYWAFICRHCDTDELRKIEWLSFVSTCVDLMKKELDLHASEIRAAVDKVVAARCKGAPIVEPIRAVDTRIATLLEAWTTANLMATEDVDATVAAAVLKKAKVYRALPADMNDFTFGDLVELTWAWSTSKGLISLYNSIAEGADCLTPEQLAAFMSHGVEGVGVTVSEAREALQKVMGGSCTKLRFIGYFGNPSTNDVLDPRKASNVWQDMSHPLTHYSISTQTVRSHDEAASAIMHGTRAFVIAVSKLNAKGVPMVSDTFSLPELLMLIRKEAFVNHELPFIICFQPNPGFTVAVQDATAAALQETLGPLLAPGLMFRGSSILDPKFTPSGLRHRVLIMAQQGPLKPFVGFAVADTMRNGLGVRVTVVNENTPAARAGIAKSDWLTHFNGEPIENVENLKAKLAALSLGEAFKIRKEGVTDVTGIVGALVPGNTDTVSKKFADLLFLNYTNTPGDGSAPHPWDTALEDLPVVPSPPHKHLIDTHHGSLSRSHSHIHCEPHSHSTHATDINSESGHHSLHHSFHGMPNDHLRFIANSNTGEDSDERELAVAEADLHGVQFIDHASPAAARWARGKFRENGHCGFVLQHTHVSTLATSENGSDEHLHEVHSNASDDMPAQIHFEISLLSQPKQRNTFLDSREGTPTDASELTCSVATIGTPERRSLPLEAISTLDVRDANHSILLLRTVDKSGVEFEATLPAHLIRPGYRVVPFIDPKDVNSAIYPVLCEVRRKSIRHSTPPSHSAEDLYHHETRASPLDSTQKSETTFQEGQQQNGNGAPVRVAS